MAEFPFVQSLGKKYKQDLKVIFVSADWLDEEKQVKDFLNSMDVSGQSYIKDQPAEEFINGREITVPILDSKAQYVFYHKKVDFALKELIVAVQQNNLCTQQEIVFFKQYADLLLYSIEAMRIKYMYDEEDNMKIDVTDSGFPNYLEFRYLYNDLSLRDNYLTKLKDVSQLQNEFLDQLLRVKEPVRRDKLFQAASIVYYTSVEQKYIFHFLKLHKLLIVKLKCQLFYNLIV